MKEIFVLLGTLAFVYAIKPLLGAVVLAIFLFYLLTPLVDFSKKIFRIRILALTISYTFFLSSTAVFLYYLINSLIKEVSSFYLILMKKATEYSGILEEFGIKVEDLLQYRELILKSFKVLTKFSIGIGSALLQIIFGIIISAYFVYKAEDLRKIEIKDEKLRMYFDFLNKGMKNVVYSIFLTSIITGFIALPIYYAFNLPYLSILFLLTVILTLIPIVGAWLVYIPLTIYLYYSHGLTEAVVFFILSVAFISVLPDILVRPLLAKTKEVNAVILLIAFFTGILAFGAPGLILGPLIFIAVVGFLKVYLSDIFVKKENKKKNKQKHQK